MGGERHPALICAALLVAWSASVSGLILPEEFQDAEVPPRGPRGFIIISVTQTWRVLSFTTTTESTYLQCFTNTDVPICSKRKREVVFLRHPPPPKEEHLETLDDYLEKHGAEDVGDLEGSPEFAGLSETTHVRRAGLLAPAGRRGRWLFQRSFSTSTTTTTVTTLTTTMTGSTVETIAYIRCRAHFDPVSPICF